MFTYIYNSEMLRFNTIFSLKFLHFLIFVFSLLSSLLCIRTGNIIQIYLFKSYSDSVVIGFDREQGRQANFRNSNKKYIHYETKKKKNGYMYIYLLQF